VSLERTRSKLAEHGGLAGYGRSMVAENRVALLLVTPTLVTIMLILWVPFLRGLWISFHEWPIVGERQFVGVNNYAFLLGWDQFYTSLKATVIYGLSTLIQLFVAIVAALIISNQQRFENVTSGLFLLPYTLPPVVSGTIWLYLLNSNFGPTWEAFQMIGILSEPLFWRSQGDLALAVVTLVGAWTFWPFMFLIILATLESIPREHYEAAEIYGASRIQRFLRVTLPQLKSAIIVAVTLRTIWNLSKVAQPFQMTQGGPGYDTTVLGILVYRFAYLNGEMGLSFSAGVFLLLITLTFIYVFLRQYEKSDQTELRG